LLDIKPTRSRTITEAPVTPPHDSFRLAGYVNYIITKILSALEAADSPEDMALPMFRFHPLTGDRRGTYSVTVKANWRVTFGFRNGAAYDVNLEDYH